MINRLLPDWDLYQKYSKDKGMEYHLTDRRAYDKPENKITEVQGVAEDSINNTPTIGINVRNDKDIDYASLIVDGKKKYESRKTDSLRPYVGKTVGIVRTGNGPAVAIGQVTIGEPIIADAEKFNKLRNQHLVPQGSKFDIDSDGTKYLYPMINPVRWDNEKPIKSKGIVSRKIQEQDITESHTQLWHGTSEPIDVIQQQGLRGGRHHAVFLTDNPDLALDYAVSDQERTGNDYVTLITVDVNKLDQKKLVGDLDHTTVDNWVDSLKETDQCMYLGDILPNMITNVEDYTDQ
jgi:predicted transcriptional regulator